MPLPTIANKLEEAIENEDFTLFKKFYHRFSNDYNAFIIDDCLEETQLNVLHFLAGCENTTFILEITRQWLHFDNVDINFQGSIEGNFGVTAAHIAVLNHNKHTLMLLIEHDCDLFRCDSFGRNVQDYAKLEQEHFPELLDIVNDSFFKLFKNKSSFDYIASLDEYLISPIHSDSEDDIPQMNKYFEKSEKTVISEYFHEIDKEIKPGKDNVEKKVSNLYEQSEENDLLHVKQQQQFPKNQTQIVIHEDRDADIRFLEERTRGTSYLMEEQLRLNSSQAGSQGSQETDSGNTSIETIIDDLILKMTNSELREHFRKNGNNPGPINDKNKKLYQKKAHRALKLQRQPEIKFSEKIPRLPLKDTLKKYHLDFESLAQKRFNFKEAIHLEEILVKSFSSDTEKHLFGSIDTSSKPEVTFFVYILLDPEITNNLPERANLSFENILFSNPNSMSLLDSLDLSLFVSFITSIFYAGKGKNNRPYQHFYDAFALKSSIECKKNSETRERKSLNKEKTKRILEIWSKGRGPISLHCFHGINSEEAFAREYLMIETLGLQNLTNRISGNSKIKYLLNFRQRKILGTYLLYKAFIILLLNGERQIKRSNKLRRF